VKPDEYFSFGPFEFARFGKNTISKSHLSKEQLTEAHVRMAAQFPKIVSEIDSLIAHAADLVSQLPSEQLLLRGYWEFFMSQLGIHDEASVGHEQAQAFRMVDYVQSLIVSIPKKADYRNVVTEEEWADLGNTVEKIFAKLNMEYQICLTAKRQIDDPDLNMDYEKFRYEAEMYWCNVRGKRYQYHEEQGLKDLLLLHSKIIEEIFGITAEALVAELIKIQHNLSAGINDAFGGFTEFREETLDRMESLINGGFKADEPQRLMAKAMEDSVLKQQGEAVFNKLFGLDLFDLEKATNLPKPLLDELTWSEGQDTDFFAGKELKGWPLRIWPVFKRPFVKLGNRYYCFDQSSLFDHIYRNIQKSVVRLRPAYKEKWNTTQKQASEELPFKYLQKILPASTTYRNVHYPPTSTGSEKKNSCEVDGLLIFEDHLFVIEVKAGAFTYTPPAIDIDAHIESLKSLISAPANQGKRFVEYLEGADEVDIFDDKHNQICRMRQKDFRHITICAVTLDSFTEMAAQAQHLSSIGVDTGENRVWPLSIDDLRVYADVFDNSLMFLHFVEERMRANLTSYVELNDELDHLGLYIEHNMYSQRAKEMADNGANFVRFHGYRSKIDTYFSAKLFEKKFGDAPEPPLRQTMPARLAEIIDFIAKHNVPKKAGLSSFLLNIAGDWRDSLSDGIEEQLKTNASLNRPRPLSTFGVVRLTVFCWSGGVTNNRINAVEHTRTVMYPASEKDRVLLELFYSDQGALENVSWQQVTLNGLSDSEIQALQQQAEVLRQRRLKNHKGKPGRNEPCPCGSGKKYKRCCGQ
jgi:hypothetical protein